MPSLYKNSLHILLPLMLGVGIYLLRGTEDLLIENFIVLPNFKVYLGENILINFIYFNLPDALWFYAFLYSIELIWENKKAKIKWLWLSLVVAIAFEIGQKYGYISGTFDILDILIYVIIFAIMLFRYYKIIEKTNFLFDFYKHFKQ